MVMWRGMSQLNDIGLGVFIGAGLVGECNAAHTITTQQPSLYIFKRGTGMKQK